MLFKDRHDAGRRLAAALQAYRGKGVLVMAVPRGGVIVAGPVAESLAAPLDVVIPRKVGLPGNPELAVAAVAPGGTVIYNEHLLRTLNLRREELKPAVDREQVEIKRRLQAYRGQARQAELTGRIVIVVDDG
ncbi:MAG: phosphoribosyltransferase, partial [Moorella sp. (in: Bacteria)]|nr:phosphoribosyltransferase [Moorella sp. (in: firmicutes)]